jgi:hypothetical protein
MAALGIVSEGEAQGVIVVRDTDQKLLFKVEHGESFADVDLCAQYCYMRSRWRNSRSIWANEVNLYFDTPLSADDRQYIGDRFVANKVYPSDMV